MSNLNHNHNQNGPAATLSAALSGDGNSLPIAPELLDDTVAAVNAVNNAGVGVDVGEHDTDIDVKDWETQFINAAAVDYYNSGHDAHGHDHTQDHDHTHDHDHDHTHDHHHHDHHQLQAQPLPHPGDMSDFTHDVHDVHAHAHALAHGHAGQQVQGMDDAGVVGMNSTNTATLGGLPSVGGVSTGEKRSRSPTAGVDNHSHVHGHVHSHVHGDEGENQDESNVGKKQKRGPRILKNKPPVEYIQDPSIKHLNLPTPYEGRGIEYSRDDRGHLGPVFVHPAHGTVQACIRCHGIKRKCDALEFDNDSQTWMKPRCSGCEKVNVPCVFELGAASSGFVYSLRNDVARLEAELEVSRRQVLELAQAQSQVQPQGQAQ